MKIAIFTDMYTPSGSGGIVTSIHGQKAELEKLGHTVTVFCPGNPADTEQIPEKNIFIVPSHKKLQINNTIIALRPEIIKQYILEHFPNFSDFDIVHVHYEASCSIAGIQLAKEFDIPLVQTLHGREDMAITCNMPHPIKLFTATVLSFLHSRYIPHNLKIHRDHFQAPTLTRAKMWRLMTNHANQADLVITPAAHLARKLEHYGVTRPIQVVSNGIPDDLVPDSKPRHYADGDVLRLVWNSRMSNEKRFSVILEALSKMRRPYMLYVYGDGNSLAKDKLYSQRHHLKVKFYGRQPRAKILDRIASSHLNLLASYNFDVQPMVMIESQALGMPVFICDPTLAEIVPPDSYILSSGADATSIAIALDNFDPLRIASMSQTMLDHRTEVLESTTIKSLLKVYDLAKKEHEKQPR